MFHSQINDIYALLYILTFNSSQTSNSNSKYKRTYTYFHSYLPLSFSHSIPHIFEPMKSHIWRWNRCWKSKTFHFAHRQMIYITYNISPDAIQANHRPLTLKTNETTLTFTHTCPFASHTQYPIYLNGWRVTYKDDQCWKSKIFKSLTDKCYISLIIYLKIHFKPNIDL